MLLLRGPLLSAVLALLVPASAALSIPSSLTEILSSDSITITNSSLKAPPGHLQNVTYTPWPPRPYAVPLYPRFNFPHLIFIRASEFHGTRPVGVPWLQDFLQEFRDNLERESPIPGFVPRLARQQKIDIQSYTLWTVETNEGIFGHRLPTEVALVALDEMARQLGSHGPTSLYFSIMEGPSVLSYGLLDVTEFGGVSSNRSLPQKESIFQTS